MRVNNALGMHGLLKNGLGDTALCPSRMEKATSIDTDLYPLPLQKGLRVNHASQSQESDIGQLLGDRYEIRQVLGQRAGRRTVLSWDHDLERQVCNQTAQFWTGHGLG